MHKLKGFAQKLRKDMTKEEKHLWYDFLKKLPVTVNRQKIIDNYIVDFYCFEAKIAIEIDGSQHYTESGKESDKSRDKRLRAIGIEVLRYTNSDINKNFEGVCGDIIKHISILEKE